MKRGNVIRKEGSKAKARHLGAKGLGGSTGGGGFRNKQGRFSYPCHPKKKNVVKGKISRLAGKLPSRARIKSLRGVTKNDEGKAPDTRTSSSGCRETERILPPC